MGMQGASQRLGFATIDFETTGLFAERSDRAIEVAVVHSDPRGTITGRWETLLNPMRDLGRHDIHGISAREILSAPTFGDIADELIELISGRVVVAHNASFDMRFLLAEFGRIGYWPGSPIASVCTMRLARTHLGGGGSLADCCAAFDIELSGAHRAGVDALATAELLAAFIASSAASEWDEHFTAAVDLPSFPGIRAAWTPRENIAPYSPSFLQRIIDRVPDLASNADQAEYVDLVERCLLDRYLSEHEKNSLVALADRVGLGRRTAIRLHHDLFTSLTAIAWSDGELSPAERSDLLLVAELLEIEATTVEAALTAPAMTQVAHQELTPRFALNPGDLVVLTGEMRRPRSAWEETLRALGYAPKSAVTKAVRIVVAADPDSLSGKAKKARDYGIPIVSEDWLDELSVLSALAN